MNKERNEESGFGFALALWESAQNRTLLWVSYIVARKIKNQTQNSSPQWQTQTYSELLWKVSGPWDTKQKSVIIRSGTVWAFLAIFYYFLDFGQV